MMKTGKGVKKKMQTNEEYSGRRFQATITKVYQRKIMRCRTVEGAGLDDGGADAGESENGGADIDSAEVDNSGAAGSGGSDTTKDTEP